MLRSLSILLGTSWYLSVFLVVNAALGSAFLNFPRAFDEAGGVVAALSVQWLTFQLNYMIINLTEYFTLNLNQKKLLDII